MRPRHASLLLPVLLAGCRTESPEAQIRKAFEGCVAAIEQADPEPPIRILSPDFAGPENMTRDEAKLYLIGLLRQEKVGITVVSSRITVQGSQATQAVELVLTSRTGGNLLPQDASRRRFTLRWERQNGAWRLRALDISGEA
jgi:hypothetical protein